MSKLATMLLLILALCPVAWAAKAGQGGPNAPEKMKWRYSYANLGYFGGRAERSDLEGNNSGIASAASQMLLNNATFTLNLDLMYTRRGRLGIEVRDIIASASFDGVTNGDADVGGQMILFVVKIGVGNKS